MDYFKEGISKSIARISHNLQLGFIDDTQEKVWNDNINRFPSEYLLNPVEERDIPAKDGDIYKDMFLLKMM